MHQSGLETMPAAPVTVSAVPNPSTPSIDPNAARISATAVLVAAWSAFVIRIFSQMNVRLGTVDLFLYQIMATCRVLAAVNMVQLFKSMYQQPNPLGFADVARKEDYFAHFDSMGSEIGDLNRLEVARTTEFFTYLKGSRDATGSFNNWVTKDGLPNDKYPPEQKKLDVLHVVYLLFLALESAHYCVEGFARKKEKQFLHSLVWPQLVDAYDFLTSVLSSADRRVTFLRMQRRIELIKRCRGAYT
jgi:hypothetical protein